METKKKEEKMFEKKKKRSVVSNRKNQGWKRPGAGREGAEHGGRRSQTLITNTA